MQVTQFVKAKVPHRRQVPGPRRATCPAARGPLLPWEEMMRVCSYLKTWLNVRVTKALRNDKYIPYVSTLVTELIRPVQLKDYRNGSIWGIKVKTVRMSGCSPSLPTAEPGSGRALGAQVCDGPCVHASGCRSRSALQDSVPLHGSGSHWRAFTHVFSQKATKLKPSLLSQSGKEHKSKTERQHLGKQTPSTS